MAAANHVRVQGNPLTPRAARYSIVDEVTAIGTVFKRGPAGADRRVLAMPRLGDDPDGRHQRESETL